VKSLRETVRTELILRYSRGLVYRTWPFEFSLDEVFIHYRRVSDALAATKDRVDGMWDETFAGMAKVVLDERAQVRAEDDYAHKLAMEAR
jgi:hypothetical protein